MYSSLDKESFVNYYLEGLNINQIIGSSIRIESTGIIICVGCKKLLKKTFFNGYCWHCSQVLPECGPCVLFPERCLHHLADTEHLIWAQENCRKPHIVYLAYTSNLKVGVTKLRNIPSRWIDQGAILAVPIITTNNRFLAGIIEKKFCEHVDDKTYWKEMLMLSNSVEINLLDNAKKLCEKETDFLSSLSGVKVIYDSAEVVSIHYPINSIPICNPLNIMEAPIEGKLLGIKGQYMCFDTGVINLRKFTGYQCNLYIL